MKKLASWILISGACLSTAWAQMPEPMFRPEPASAVSAMPGYQNGRTRFHVTTTTGLRIDYNVFALFALPGDEMGLNASERVSAVAENIPGLQSRGSRVNWRAPEEPGLYPLELRTPNGNAMRINLFVMQPASDVEDEHLDDYRIGAYPEEPYRGLDVYLPPAGFAAVTEDLRNVQLSPHFTIGQFLCKQESGWPKFVHVRPQLVIKLERLLEAVNNAGIEADSFVVMSGYRTPHYNEAIGNVEHSRHVFGGAADIYIDVAPVDGIMDDLNGDGELNEGDSAWLYRFIDDLSRQPEWTDMEGGLGQYGSTWAHGPFVHVDERGWVARWGG